MTADRQHPIDLPLQDTGAAKQPGTAHMRQRLGRRRLFLVPLFFAVLFSGAVVGLYFQPPGVQALFRATGLQPGGGTDTPIALAIQQVTDKEEIAVVSEGDVVALGRITPRGDIVTVATPFGSSDARISALHVSEGDQVQAGDNAGILLRGTKKDEVQRGMVVCKPGSIKPHREFECEVYVLSKEEGGRHTPFFKGYRPQFYFRTTDVTGTVELPSGTEMVMPGDNLKFTVELIAPIAMEDGLRFAIREGGRTVGSGVVSKIIE